MEVKDCTLLKELESINFNHPDGPQEPKDRNLASEWDENLLSSLAQGWEKSCTNTESTLHQLSPYIGKLKSSIAKDLITNFSPEGGLIADPFAGSGTVLLEAVRLGRRAFGVDISPYAALLSKAKLSAPDTLEEALLKADRMLISAKRKPSPDLRKIPSWVKDFFHPSTLIEAINFANECQEQGDSFLFACMLGILHHQRPGFLSYPSSHLTPYLRDKKFPKAEYPELYEYRALAPRLIEKIKRAYKRKDFSISTDRYSFIEGNVENISFPQKVDCVITSPPYMNALDYGRDNRLRLWFIGNAKTELIDNSQSQHRDGFQPLMAGFAKQVVGSLIPNGYCILIVGDQTRRGSKYPLSVAVQETFNEFAPQLTLVGTVRNSIPDIRRARRDYRGIRTENFLIYQNKNA